MIDKLLRTAARREGIISFAGGLPAPETFPRRALARASSETLSAAGGSALQYDWPEGRLELRQRICERMARRGVVVDPKDVVITSGAQDALAIATEVIGALTVQVDAASYPGALDMFEASSCDPQVGGNLAVRYVMPAVSNPFGTAMDYEQRRACLLGNTIVIEDDAYADLRFDGPSPAPLLAQNAERVYYVGTFSKILAPGLRVGWLIAPKAKHDQVLEVKARRDLQTCGLSQAIVERLLAFEDFDFEARLESLRKLYKLRCERMLTALARVPGIKFQVPVGGFSIWVETEIPGNDASCLYAALENGVAFDPGELFLARADQHPTLAFRLSYSSVPMDQIEEGVARLARALGHSRELSLAA